jgi:hypothetical protein
MDLSFKITDSVSLPAVFVTPYSFTIPGYTDYEQTKNGVTTRHVAAMSTTAVLVRDKVIFLYAYADGKEIQWVNEAGRVWSRALLAANGVSLDAARPSAQPASSPSEQAPADAKSSGAVLPKIILAVLALLLGGFIVRLIKGGGSRVARRR